MRHNFCNRNVTRVCETFAVGFVSDASLSILHFPRSYAALATKSAEPSQRVQEPHHQCPASELGVYREGAAARSGPLTRFQPALFCVAAALFAYSFLPSAPSS